MVLIKFKNIDNKCLENSKIVSSRCKNKKFVFYLNWLKIIER